MTTIKVIHNLGDTEYLVLKSMIGDVGGKFSVNDIVDYLIDYGHRDNIKTTLLAMQNLIRLYKKGLVKRGDDYDVDTLYWVNIDIQIEL